MIIFGWGHQTQRNHGPVNRKMCPHCNNAEPWELLTASTWFTLFFIPIIPYSRKKIFRCPICNYGVELTESRFEELKLFAAINMELIEGRITQGEYDRKIRQLQSIYKLS